MCVCVWSQRWLPLCPRFCTRGSNYPASERSQRPTGAWKRLVWIKARENNYSLLLLLHKIRPAASHPDTHTDLRHVLGLLYMQTKIHNQLHFCSVVGEPTDRRRDPLHSPTPAAPPQALCWCAHMSAQGYEADRCRLMPLSDFFFICSSLTLCQEARSRLQRTYAPPLPPPLWHFHGLISKCLFEVP